MFLKGLTIKGFKSFADPATLELEPGITVVVGPNGSGKSNVVDAIAWVLGAQAPTSVRSQKMGDVIFAGTQKKKALGRAEVSLTIDNSDGDLNIDFAEVTITRTLFKSGESSYSINGVDCRLLDIQELLSDSGVGKQQHIIVSQGQIDEILNAKPEDRRMIIEEAAGVLKYRKRRERAERRLEATGQDTKRLTDLQREVRRQLKPLKQQAEAAERRDKVEAELRAIQLFIAGKQLADVDHRLFESAQRKEQLAGEMSQLADTIATVDSQKAAAESELAKLGASDVGEALSSVIGLAERAKGQLNVIDERRARLDSELATAVDEGLVSSLEAEAARVSAEIAVTSAELDAVTPEFSELEVNEAALVNKQLSFDEQWGDSIAPSSARAAEVRAQIEALTATSKRSEARLGWITQQTEKLDKRRVAAESSLSEARQMMRSMDEEIPHLEEGLSQAAARLGRSEIAATEASVKRTDCESRLSHWSARREALEESFDSIRQEAGLKALADVTGVLGILSELIVVDPGWELAVEAALGAAATSIVVADVESARVTLADLTKDIGGIGMSVLGDQLSVPLSGSNLRTHIKSNDLDVSKLLDVLCEDVVAVDGGWPEGLEAAISNPERTIVTTAGDCFSPGHWKVGEEHNAVSGAALVEAQTEADEVREQLVSAKGELDKANKELFKWKTKVSELTKQMTRATEGRDKARQTVEFSERELSDISQGRHELDAERKEIFSQKQSDSTELKKLAAELPNLEAQEASQLERAAALSSSRQELETQTKHVAAKRSELEVREAQLKKHAQDLSARLAEIEQRLKGLATKRAEAERRRVAIQSQLDGLASLRAQLGEHTLIIERWRVVLSDEKASQSEAATKLSETLEGCRRATAEVGAKLSDCQEESSGLEVSAAEDKVRRTQLVEAISEGLGSSIEEALKCPEPVTEPGVNHGKRVSELQTELQLIGAVNPLAMVEYQELVERQELLSEQLDDVKRAKRDLQGLINSINAEIVEVFEAAFRDVADNFGVLFDALFPGGKGKLRLINDEDLLNCGLEIDAKPSGKSVKKLSLLSGGERSLVALAFLFSVFKSRPSPFYVMDEVEAALDDTNVSRFLALIEEFRKEAQLIIVSHQKRTMECANVLYGVSMAPGGSSVVVSEKV